MGLSLAVRAQAFLPSPVGAARMPVTEPLPCGKTCEPPPPNLVPGPLSPDNAPPGPSDDLSLPANHSSAFQCETFPPESCVYAAVGTQALQRQKLGKGAVAVFDQQNQDTGTFPPSQSQVAQRFNDLTPDMAFGVRATIGYLFHDQSVELTGFYIPTNEASRILNNQGRIDAFFFNPPIGFEGNNGLWLQADRLRTSLTTQIGSAELNYRCWNVAVNGFEFIAGLRYLDHRERLNVFTGDDDLSFGDVFGNPDPKRQATYTSQVRNHIVAPQVGFEWAGAVFHCLGVGMSGKVALGPNFVEDNVALTRGDGFSGFNTHQSRTIFSQVYEVGAFVDFHLLEKLRVRAGYNALWLGGIHTAQDLLDFNLANTAGRNNDDGSTFYHGPQVELQLLF